MIDLVDQRLKDWVNTVINQVASLGPPNQQKAGQGVGLYLMEIAQAPPPSTGKLSPLQLALRYLVTAWSDRPEDAHRVLGELLFAAMENPDFEVERDPVPITIWTAFGLPPCPSFVLRVPLRKERPDARAKPVRMPLTLMSSPVIGFHGLLLGPRGIPLADSRVEMPALRLSTSTDYKGRFHFSCVPAEGVKLLRIKAKGRELSVSSNDNYPDSMKPLVVRFNSLEE